MNLSRKMLSGDPLLVMNDCWTEVIFSPVLLLKGTEGAL